MKKLKVSEMFYSLQGEGIYTGHPSVFLRLFGCPLKCQGFGMPRGEKSNEADIIASQIDNVQDVNDLPLSRTGCDSYFSWHPKFKHLSKLMTPDEIVDKFVSIVPFEDLSKVHFVITGGEPLLWQGTLEPVIERLCEKGIRFLTFETNGIRTVSEGFTHFLNWMSRKHMLQIMWSVSPKLPLSGHVQAETLFPESILSMNKVYYSTVNLKYVVRNEKDLKFVEQFNNMYISRGAKFSNTYLMPEGGVIGNEFVMTEREVAELCMKHGYAFTSRMHLHLFGNSMGT